MPTNVTVKLRTWDNVCGKWYYLDETFPDETYVKTLEDLYDTERSYECRTCGLVIVEGKVIRTKEEKNDNGE